MNSKYLFLLLIILFQVSCKSPTLPEISKEDLRYHTGFLASDSLKGRYPGTAEDSVLMRYLAGQFKSFGLRAFYDSYIHNFDILTGVRPSASNTIGFRGESYQQESDFFPLSFSASGEIEEGLVFASYGFEFEDGDIIRSDYGDTDPSGKWVLILMGEPVEKDEYLERSGLRDKAMLAQSKGAAGVFFAAGESFSPYDKLDTKLQRLPELDIPVIQLTRRMADIILSSTGFTINQLEQLCKKTDSPAIEIQEKLYAAVEIQKEWTQTGNVAGWLPGTDPESQEWLVVGAHHDHLGMGGSGTSSRAPDTLAVHNGADDNASGVAAVLELAEYFAEKEHRPGFNLLFTTFGAEEKGLLGSAWFVEHSPVALNTIISMINIDMLGRMSEDSVLQIGGVGTSNVSREIVNSANKEFALKLSLSDAGYGPSDHSSFYLKDIPVFFISTGAHADYHTPFDDIDSLNFEGLQTATRYIASLIGSLDQLETRPEFRESGAKVNPSGRSRSKITLGIMPDVSGAEGEGMKVLAVSNGKPAAAGGMKKGDIILRLDGNPVSNIYDYMYHMKNFTPGQSIIVSIKREDTLMDLLIQL